MEKPGRQSECEPEDEALVAMERELGEALLPIRPEESFRRALKERSILLVEARGQREPPLVLEAGYPRKLLLEAAAAGSLFSIVGVAAFFLRSRKAKPTLRSQ